MYVITKKQIFKFLGVLALISIVFGVIIAKPTSIFTFSKSEKTVDWGLSYQKEGQTPVGNESSENLGKNNAYYVGDTSKKVIYLTFDCGYEAGYTQKILDILKKHNVKATFFVVGNYLKSEPEIIKRMNSEGHIVGNHTYSHPDMAKITDEAKFLEELKKVEDEYKQITGEEMKKYYRPPQGKFSEDNLKMANKAGYKTFFWSLAYVDWYKDKQPSKEEAFSKLIPRIHPGSIVLLHNTSETNANILDELLTKWESMGYTFKNLGDVKKVQTVKKEV